MEREDTLHKIDGVWGCAQESIYTHAARSNTPAVALERFVGGKKFEVRRSPLSNPATWGIFRVWNVIAQPTNFPPQYGHTSKVSNSIVAKEKGSDLKADKLTEEELSIILPTPILDKSLSKISVSASSSTVGTAHV